VPLVSFHSNLTIPTLSLDPLPLRSVVLPIHTAWSGPAFAVGGVVLGLRIVRRAEPGRLGAGLGYVLFGAVGLVLGLLVLPGSTVTIPGAAQLKDMIAFIVLIGVLMIRPIGLLGERLAVEERV